MSRLVLNVIGTVHSPFRHAAGTPIQSAMAQGAEGSVEVLPEFVPGLKDLEGFERIWLLYWFDRATPERLTVKPFLDAREHGVFATRAPCRPNPIGLSCVRLLGVQGGRLHVGDLDILDETPLLDIKPYATTLDSFKVRRAGWLQNKSHRVVMADDRFERKQRLATGSGQA
jgi:tRNA (adenine37-N6)-methyltransferase